MSKSATKRIEHLEGVCIGAGFLLQKLMNRYAKDLGDGMFAQMRDCIRDCNEVSRVKTQRDEANKSLKLKREESRSRDDMLGGAL